MSARITPLELKGITRRFGRNVVLRDIDLELEEGELVGLMGANGSGKTTLFSIIAGLLPPDAGEQRFAGRSVLSVETEVRARLAYVAHAPQLYPLLTARENLELFERLRGAAGEQSQSAVELLGRLGLGDVVDQPVATFSRGMAQRVVLARALAGNPDVLLLDEPFTALDRAGRAVLAGLLAAERDRGAAILLSSHDVDSLVDVADRVLLLENGVIARSISRATDAPQLEDFRAGVASLQHLGSAKLVGSAEMA